MSEKKLGNLIGWVDLAVGDLARAMDFYTHVLARKVEKHEFEGFSFGVVEHGEGNGACLIPNAEFEPQTKGHLLYFDVDGRIRAALEEVKAHGGSVLQDVHPIGPHGFRAVVLDSEGSQIALHANSDS